MSKLNRNLITKIPIEKAIIPFDGAKVMTDRYWIIEDESILFWNKYSPQCNSQKEIAESIQKKIYPNGSVRFLPIIYVEPDNLDWSER